jgi:TnpA family transposase
MPRRLLLTNAERQELLALPSDENGLIRYWSLEDADRRLFETRRRADTRLGLALQLCAPRYPGRFIERGEVIPEPALTSFADQLGLGPNAVRILRDVLRRATSGSRYCVRPTASRI